MNQRFGRVKLEKERQLENTTYIVELTSTSRQSLTYIKQGVKICMKTKEKEKKQNETTTKPRPRPLVHRHQQPITPAKTNHHTLCHHSLLPNSSSFSFAKRAETDMCTTLCKLVVCESEEDTLPLRRMTCNASR